jgi:hypothetical protein
MGRKHPDDERAEPSLELPSLRLPGFRRRKTRAETEETARAPLVDPSAPPPDALSPEPAQPEDRPDSQPDTQPVAAAEALPEAEPATRPVRRRKARRARRKVPARLAAIVVGVLVGAFGTVLTYGSMRGCAALEGTTSCGGPGLFPLVAVVLLMVLLGAALLKAWQVSEPRGTSLLGVGLLCMVVLVGLTGQVFSVWMFVAVPLICAMGFAVAEWVTTRVVEPNERAPGPDVR